MLVENCCQKHSWHFSRDYTKLPSYIKKSKHFVSLLSTYHLKVLVLEFPRVHFVVQSSLCIPDIWHKWSNLIASSNTATLTTHNLGLQLGRIV